MSDVVAAFVLDVLFCDSPLVCFAGENLLHVRHCVALCTFIRTIKIDG